MNRRSRAALLTLFLLAGLIGACAVGLGHLRVARLLLDHRANVNARDAAGNTPLMTAASLGPSVMRVYLPPLNRGICTDLVRLLLDHGVDPNLAGANADTPRLIAVEYQRSNIIALFKRYGARK